MISDPTLVVFSGRPGVGKTTLARPLAARLGAAYLRIDTIERALARSVLAIDPAQDAGYVAAYALAEDNLRNGLGVVADSVNPIALTRDAFAAVAQALRVPLLEVEVICSDAAEHRRRVEGRAPDLPGQRLPTWADVRARDWEPWPRERLVIDTARLGVADALDVIAASVALRRGPASAST
ncbi:AAA family ATPase [Salinarimonas sp.]|uniref:AAA family ATPase n=1 Tax=Salinarimonas sp. TaxID=2766526 RepID=UPI0032D9467A